MQSHGVRFNFCLHMGIGDGIGFPQTLSLKHDNMNLLPLLCEWRMPSTRLAFQHNGSIWLFHTERDQDRTRTGHDHEYPESPTPSEMARADTGIIK